MLGKLEKEHVMCYFLFFLRRTKGHARSAAAAIAKVSFANHDDKTTLR